MDRQLLLAVALSALVVIGYQEYLRIYYPPKPKMPVAAPVDGSVGEVPPPREALPAALTPPVEAAAVAAPLPEADIAVETPLFAAQLATTGGRLVSLRLKQYRTSIDPSSPPLELVKIAAGGELPLGVTLRGAGAPWNDHAVVYQASQRGLSLSDGQSGEIVLRGALADGGAIEKHLHFDAARYAFDVAVQVSDGGKQYAEASLGWAHGYEPPGARYTFHGSEALLGGKLRQFTEKELAQGVVAPEPTTGGDQAAPLVHWAGYSDSYFLSSLSPRENDHVRLWLKLDRGQVTTEILVPASSATAAPYPFTVYTGPKDLHTLADAGHHLTRAVNLGWFGFIAEPMLRLLKFFHGLTGNYGLDVILLTVLVKVVLIPLTNKSYKSMQEMQRLQPQMKKLQEKYADDKEALNRELMELYRRHNVNPLGGCLPMAVQMPVFIGLYNALQSAVELRHAPFALWINDLSAPDRLPALTQPPLAVIAGYDVRIPVLTLLMGASMLLQQRMAPPAGDPTQQRMMMFMPVVFTVMFINFPSGLVLYWLVNNVLTIAQQAMMQRGRS